MEAEPSAPTIGSEVETLRNELRLSNEKLIRWQSQAKIGVDQLRQRVVELTDQLETSENARKLLLAQSPSPSGPSSSNHIAAVGEDGELFRFHLFLADTIFQCACDKGKLFVDAAKEVVSEGGGGGGAAASQEHEAYKRRINMTLKLQAKNCEALQNQTEELKEQLRQTSDTLRERERVLAMRDSMLLNLEQRLESAELVKQKLEEKHDNLLKGPNMDQLNIIEERMEQELEHIREEHAARERAIFVQHHDELERLRGNHDVNLRALHTEYEERMVQAVADALSAQKDEQDLAKPKPGATCKEEDAAYMDLLKEYQLLEDSHRKAMEENAALRKAKKNATSERPQNNGAGAGDGGAPSPQGEEPTSLPDALAKIRELRAHVGTLTDQLWRAKKSLLEAKQNQAAAATAPGTMSAQQVTYLKSIVIRLLCAREKDAVVLNLLPVLSMLLVLDGDDLKLIYEAHPDWMAKK